MTGKLMQIIRENQDAIYAAAIEQVRQRWPHYAQAPEEALRRSWAAILEALADFWERGDEAKALAWVEMRAHLSANLGFPAAEVLGGLDLLPGLIRPHLERELPRKADLLAALAQLEEGVALLRRAYLEAHFAMHQRRLAWLHELSVAVSAERDPERVLERILAAARELAGARYAALAVYQDERLARFIPLGLSEEEVHAIGDLPTGHGLLGALTKERRTLRLRALREHPRFSGFPPHHPEMRSFLGVPILIRDRVYGRLYLIEKEGADEFSEDDQHLVEMLAHQAAVAIENARLYQDVQRSAVSRGLVGQMLRDLQAVGGLSEEAMFRAGQELANRVAADALPGFLEAFSAMGLGTLTLAEAEEEQQRWTFHGDGLVESQVGSDRPTHNYYTRGFLCGAVSRVLGGTRVAGVETACQSMGDEMCEFVVQAIE